MHSRYGKWALKVSIILLAVVVYLVSSVPVGLFLYSLKSDVGLNVFSKTGFHAYLQCLSQQAKIAAEGHE